MRIELTRVGLLVYLANHYTTRGAHAGGVEDPKIIPKVLKSVSKRLLFLSKISYRKLSQSGESLTTVSRATKNLKLCKNKLAKTKKN